MNKLLIFMACMLMCVLASCINSNLDDIDSYTESKITNIRFEYRWVTSGNQLHVKTLTVQKTINEATNTVECSITVPGADNTFTEAVRNNVTLANICGYFTLSTGATVTPLGNAPTMGTIADFSNKDFDYEVTAADGSKTTWKLKITGFTK